MQHKADYLLFWQVKTWRWPSSFACLNRFTKLSKTRHSSPWFVVAILSRTARLSCCIACGWFMCTHYFRYTHRSKPVAVRSGDRTGQEIPDTWKYSLSFVNRSVVTKQVSKWHVIVCYSMCRLPPTPWVGQNFVLKCVNRFCTTLYIKIHNNWRTPCCSC
jgi:hypothetical protein